MKVYVLFNPRAGSADQIEALRQVLAADPAVTLRELGPDESLTEIIAAAVRDGFDIVAAAGGDGTVHATINGLVGAGQATLAVLPLGTGNDFCRTMGIPLDPIVAVGLLRTGCPRSIDAVRVEGAWTGYMVNAATGGFSGAVAAGVTAERKAAWGSLAYLRGAVGPVTDPPRFGITLRLDSGPPERLDVLNLVVANARTAAGGIPVAPTANPEDGKLDVVIVQAGDTLDLSVIAARLMHGDYLGDEHVLHRLAARVEIVSEQSIPFSIDGEPCEGKCFTFTVVPNALRILTGPDYRPTAIAERAVEDEEEGEQVAVPKGVAQRLFGFLVGILLLVKRAPWGVVAGAAVTAVAVLLFAGLANGVEGGEWRAWNDSVLKSQHARASPELDRLALAASWLGNGSGVILVVVGLLVLFLWRKYYLTAATLVAVVLGVLTLEVVLKPFFGIARPNLFPSIAPAMGYSFPSGHALRGIGIYGFLAALAAVRGWQRRQPLWWLLAIFWSVVGIAICWSRVYLGVHTPTDVIAGGLAASAWVATCLSARHYAMTRPRNRAT